MIEFKLLESSQIGLIISMMQDFYSIDNYPIAVEVSRKLFLDFISNENLGKVWLIYSNEEIVGYTILTFIFSFEYGGKIAFLDELYIKENVRGEGIGTKTLQFIKVQSELLKIKLLYLEVENQNEIAQKLYHSKGFVNHNRKIFKLKLT